MTLETRPRRPYRTALDRKVIRIEDAEFARRVRTLGLHVIYGGQYDPPLAVAAGQQIVGLADRRLRQLEGPNDAA